jgi:hypothetical protein
LQGIGLRIFQKRYVELACVRLLKPHTIHVNKCVCVINRINVRPYQRNLLLFPCRMVTQDFPCRRIGPQDHDKIQHLHHSRVQNYMNSTIIFLFIFLILWRMFSSSFIPMIIVHILFIPRISLECKSHVPLNKKKRKQGNRSFIIMLLFNVAVFFHIERHRQLERS